MLKTRIPLILAAATLSFSTPAVAQNPGAIVGEIRAFAISERNAPYMNLLYAAGWLPADGRSLPKSQFAQLSNALGTTWGRPQDSASFVLPDLRGVFVRGYAGQSARDPDKATRTASAPGGASGNTVGSMELDAMQRHGHIDRGHAHGLGINVYKGGTGPGLSTFNQSFPQPVMPMTSSVAQAQIGDPTPSSAGTPKTSTETRPVNISLYYFIYTGRAIPRAFRR